MNICSKIKSFHDFNGFVRMKMDKTKIGDVCDILNGYAFKSENYTDSGIRVIRIANAQKGYIEDTTPAFYPLDSNGLEKYMLEEGDLLMSLTGNVGRVALLEKEMLPAALNQRVACLRLKSDQISKGYLFHILNSDFFEQQCIQSSKGVAQKNMSTEWLKDYEIPLFSLEQQKTIEDILDKVRMVIENRKVELQKLDELIKARFVELFGNPEQNEKGWKTCRLGDECTVINGRAYKAEELLDEGKYRVLRVGNFFTNDSWYYSDLELDKDKYCDNGDLLFAWSASFGPRIWHGEKVIYHYHIWKLIGYEECLNKDFFVELLNYNCDVMKRGTHGSTMLHFTKSQMEDQKLILPPMEMQEQFADFVHQVDKSKFKEISTTYIYCFNYMMSS